MAKKLVFQKDIGGNNISVDQESRESNLWTIDTFSDFGVFALVYFDSIPYVNVTGVFTTTDPSQDTTNWQSLLSSNNPEKLNDLTDVTIVNPMTGDELVYNSTTSMFENQQPAAIPTDLNDLTDVEVSTAVVDQLLGYNGTDWVNINAPSSASTSLNGLTDVTIDPATLRNTNVLEYDSTDTQWKNVDIPSGVINRLEDLEDVSITDQLPNKIIISESRAAALDVETIDAANIFGVDVSANLMVISPVSNAAIDQIAFGITRGASTDSITYVVTDTQLLVELRFTSATTTRDQIYTAAATAMQTNFSNGPGNNEIIIDGNTYARNGEWSTPTNPRFTPGSTAAGTITYNLLQTAGATDTSEFIYTFNSGFGSISSRFDIANRNIDTNTLADIVNEITIGLNANVSFSPNFTATNSQGTLTITANEPGAQGNAVLHGFMREDSPTNQDPSTVFNPAASTLTVTGGVDTDDSTTILRWIDVSHQHEITRPLAFEQAILHFKQGAFSWRDEDFEIGNLIDVNPNANTFPQMLVKPQSQDVFNYTDVRIQNLDVDNQTDRLKSGTMLQYTTGNADWAYIGLGDDGTVDANNQPNYTLTPADGQFMVYDFRGGFGPQWTAHNAVLNNLFDVNTENQTRGAVLVRGASEWSAESVIPGQLFVELGNRSNLGLGVLPMSNATFDPTYSFTSGEEFVTIEVDGAYELSMAFSKNLVQDAMGTDSIDETLEFFISKNNASTVVANTNYAGIQPQNQLFTSTSFTIPQSPTPGVVNSSTGNPQIINLIAGDTIRVRFEYVTFGTTGVTMSDGLFGKSWLKINRVR